MALWQYKFVLGIRGLTVTLISEKSETALGRTRNGCPRMLNSASAVKAWYSSRCTVSGMPGTVRA
eukprot:1260732-Rhodomonas_salina.1